MREAAVQPDGAEPEISGKVRRGIPETNTPRDALRSPDSVKQQCSMIEQNLKFLRK